MTEPVQPSAQRIWDQCEALAKLSEMPGGLTRVYLSDEQRRANELVLGWMREAGMSARLDAAGNCVGRYEGDRPGLPALVLGSHLDTVRDAGKYDGMLGVIAGIECVRTLHARGRRLAFAIEVIGFADEEGVRFNATLLGSRAAAGTFKPEVLDAVDKEGVSMREAMRRFGLDPSRIAEAAHRRNEVLAYAELHIEQGPVLEAEGLPVGVVTAINGATRFAVEVDGMAGHAGTVQAGSPGRGGQGRRLDARGDAAVRARSGADRRGCAPPQRGARLRRAPHRAGAGARGGGAAGRRRHRDQRRHALRGRGRRDGGPRRHVPMNLRQDALVAAAECVLAIERRCSAVPELVGTVGKLETLPGAVNVVPGKVRFTIDIRSPRDPERLAAVADVLAELRAIGERRNVSIKATKTHEGAVAPCAGWLQEQIGARSPPSACRCASSRAGPATTAWR